MECVGVGVGGGGGGEMEGDVNDVMAWICGEQKEYCLRVATGQVNQELLFVSYWVAVVDHSVLSPSLLSFSSLPCHSPPPHARLLRPGPVQSASSANPAQSSAARATCLSRSLLPRPQSAPSPPPPRAHLHPLDPNGDEELGEVRTKGVAAQVT